MILRLISIIQNCSAMNNECSFTNSFFFKKLISISTNPTNAHVYLLARIFRSDCQRTISATNFSTTMLYNYFIIALRNLMRRKGMAFVNIFGLALGMACCILLMLTVREEMSYDNFHQNKDRIYNLFQRSQTSEGERVFQTQPVPIAQAIKAELPNQVQYASRYTTSSPTAVKYNGTVFRQFPCCVDPDFFKMFSFQFLQGNPDAALSDLRSIVLTKEVADKMFGENAQVIGKQVTVLIDGETLPFTISGVIADLPRTSTIEFDVAIRFEHTPDYKVQNTRWDNFSTNVFICTKENVAQTAVEQALVPFVNTHFAESIKERKTLGIKAGADGSYIKECLQPLSDMHFGATLDPNRNGKTNVILLAAIAAFILLIASINFINLSLARSFTRSREVGIRKTVGARRSQIVLQFLGEATLIVVFAMILSLVLAEILLPMFNAALGTKHALILRNGKEIDVAENLVFWGAAMLAFFVIGISAGAYPAFYVSNLQAASTMKSRAQGINPSLLRNILVVVQFTLAVGLIACTLVTREQMSFLQNKPLGFNREHVLMIPTGDGANGRSIMEKFRSTLGANPNIVAMSTATKPVGRGLDGSNTTSHSTWNFNGGEVGADILAVNFGYLETMQIPLLAGRTFDKSHQADTSESIIVNEASARQIWNLMLEQERKRRSASGEFLASAMIGVQIPRSEPKTLPTDATYEAPMTIIGVTANYHFESLRREIAPALHAVWNNYPASYIFVRIRSENVPETVAALEAAWKIAAPDTPWIGSFLDDNIERLYRSQRRISTLTFAASGITIALSCMGLFALAAIIILQRTKEIGIRKVLGASVLGLIGLLTKDFLKLVAIAIVIAIPIAWYLMENWLKTFAYKIEMRSAIGVGMFAFAGVLAVCIAFFTVAFQATRAARANPVDALKSE